MRDKRLLLNSGTSFLYQIITIICGFILPKCYLITYGSEVNGIVSSITQFLGFISLMDLGISAVVKSSLYKPLVERNNKEISAIMLSAKRFFNKVVAIFSIYVVLLCIFFAKKFSDRFDGAYTILLILAMAISTIAQYFFGIVNQTLLEADQKNYIPSILNVSTLVVNTICSVILMQVFGASIQVVKLVTSLIYLVRPLYMYWYVQKKYRIDYGVSYTVEPIKQKWNGILQHVAFVVMQNTDVFVLTIFSTLVNVSIYNIYALVVTGVKNLVISLTSGVQAKMGKLLAEGKKDELVSFFEEIEFTLHSVVTIVFTATMLLIVPFVRVYTDGINDANYIVPVFGILLTIAHFMYCLRLPYSMIVLAAGHFKETQTSAIIEMVLNIVLSIILVSKWGLNGVAVGTVFSMLYRTIYYVVYISKNIIQRNVKHYIKHMFVDIIVVVISVLVCKLDSKIEIAYLSWIILAIKNSIIVCFIFGITNMIFYRDKVKQLVTMINRKK